MENSIEQIQNGNHNSGRVEYIDAMRGITMIVLVIEHVLVFCFGKGVDMPTLTTYLNVIMLPSFFFVSGFVSYKKNGKLNCSSTVKKIGNRFRRLIIPTFIFFLCYVYAKRLNLQEALLSNMKAGYWFTYVLFEFLLFYFFIRLISSRMHDRLKDIFFICCGIGFYVASMPSVLECIPDQYGLTGILCIKQWRYFISFVFGILAKKHIAVFQRKLDGNALVTYCLVVFFLVCICWEVVTSWHSNFVYLITSLAGTVLVFNFFRIHSMFFSNKTAVGKTLCFIGRRTLDIYFMHYFLLPLNMSHYVPLFYQYPIPVVEFFINVAISSAIIAVCLCIGAILRQSLVLSQLLFGEKIRS